MKNKPALVVDNADKIAGKPDPDNSAAFWRNQAKRYKKENTRLVVELSEAKRDLVIANRLITFGDTLTDGKLGAAWALVSGEN